MKALTVYQPWASLLACGAKTYETRSWATNYRGPIAIHAAAIKPNSALRKMYPLGEWSYAPDYQTKREFLLAVLKALYPSEILDELDTLSLGAVIATAELAECWKIMRNNRCGVTLERWDENASHYFKDVQGDELLFGDWTPGHYAWECANMTLLPEPIPAKGRQGLWNWEPGSVNRFSGA